MNLSDKFLKILIVSIILYYFIESFYNLMVSVNSYIFMNLSEITSILPILAITILLVVLLVISFNTKRLIKPQYRLIIIIVIISILRLISQFIILVPLLLLANFLILFSTMIFFNEIIFSIDTKQISLDFHSLIAGMIIGLGIQFIFLILEISSNISTQFIKLIPNLVFLIGINLISIKFFTPSRFTLAQPIEDDTNNKKDISYVHFIILGVLFLFGLIWIFNPMALSAYAVINFNFLNQTLFFPWFSYGFTYYIMIILISAMVTYLLITEYVLRMNKKQLKLFSLIFGTLFLLINLLSIIFINQERSLISTIFFTLNAITNTGFLVYYALYLFNFYRINSRLKLLLGMILFFMSILIFIILQVQILWYEYISLLLNVIILIGVVTSLILVLEGFNFSKLIKLRINELNIEKKSIGILFTIILVIDGGCLGIISIQRGLVQPGASTPTFMTWNIHNAIGVDDSFNLDRLVNEIKLKDPDILGLNEVDLGALKTSFVDIGSYFAHSLQMYYFYGYTFYNHYGNVLLSKYPILNAEIIELPLIVSTAEPRSMIKATIEIDSSLWTIYITHLSTKTQDRQAQVPFIIDFINEFNFENVVWMGDFNFEPEDIEYGLINSTTILNFTDTYSYLNTDPGFTGHFDDNFSPQKRIDYIMCSPNLNPTLSEVFCSISSDHCALITKF